MEKGNVSCVSDLDDSSGPRVDDSHLLVLAGGEQLRAVPVPTSAVDDVRVAVDVHQNLAHTHVPDGHLIV